MISTVTFAPSYQPKAAVKKADPQPTPAPPQPPADAVDFTSTDCPKKAAMLPILDPAVHIGIIAGALSGVMGGNPNTVFVDAAIRAGSAANMPGDNAISVNYIID